MRIDVAQLDVAIGRLAARLCARRVDPGHWEGRLAASALSTGTAILALHLTARSRGAEGARPDEFVQAGARWLIDHQNSDGGWGDTTRSRSNISTTTIVWAALSKVGESASVPEPAIARAADWLRGQAGDIAPEALRSAILTRYGKDQTFSVPILTVMALTGTLGANPRGAWRSVPQLPFELAAVPHHWFQHLQLPVVSYALPALIAIGQVRHHHLPSRNPVTRLLRTAISDRTLRILREMQPASGGYLEATPLTSFVVMSLAGAGRADSPVAEHGVRFLLDSMRPDGSWPIDTNLATWVTTLSIDALARAEALLPADRLQLRRWLIDQQSTSEHPFTHAAPGAWAWTPLSGGVPDGDDTSGAVLALHHVGDRDDGTVRAASAGIRWLLGVQNRDGGVPTFCRGWGTLPFDRSTPEITAHALQAWSAWRPHVGASLQRDIDRGARRAIRFLARVQRSDGSWVPLWFGNERAPEEENPVYGTARVLLGLQTALTVDDETAARCLRSGLTWLRGAQNADGGWGGDRGVPSSIEETGVALSALASLADGRGDETLTGMVIRGAEWLADATAGECQAAPVGLYFARLWYYEELYPLVFALHGLASVRRALAARGERGGEHRDRRCAPPARRED